MKKLFPIVLWVFMLTACNNRKYPDHTVKSDSNTPFPYDSSKGTPKLLTHPIDFTHVKPSTSFGNDSVTVKIKSVNLTNQFIFDRYEDEWHYFDAERGSKLVVVSTSITSRIKDPALPPIAAYKLDSTGSLTLIGVLDYRFYQWKDYGAYLGNYADYDNDFAHVATIPFGAFKQIEDSDLQKPIYVVGQRAGCFERDEDRLHTPAIQYLGGCNIKENLTDIDFQKEYVLLKILDAGRSASVKTD